jgi:hypothetical protein
MGYYMYVTPQIPHPLIVCGDKNKLSFLYLNLSYLCVISWTTFKKLTQWCCLTASPVSQLKGCYLPFPSLCLSSHSEADSNMSMFFWRVSQKRRPQRMAYLKLLTLWQTYISGQVSCGVSLRQAKQQEITGINSVPNKLLCFRPLQAHEKIVIKIFINYYGTYRVSFHFSL